jgi:signal peptidase I
MKDKIKKILKNTVIGIIIFVVVTNLFVYKIPTTSMVPTLMPGDSIFVNIFAYSIKLPFTSFELLRLGKVSRGDIIVFRAPSDKSKVYVKRLIGLSGENIAIRGGNIYIDGKEVVIPSIASNYYYNQGEYGQSQEGIVVPGGHYFFLGDNSIASADSRFWGFAKEEDIIGKAVSILWPLARVNIVE